MVTSLAGLQAVEETHEVNTRCREYTSHWAMHYLLSCASGCGTPLADLVFFGGALFFPSFLATLVIFSRAGRLLGTFDLVVGCGTWSVTASRLGLCSLECVSAFFSVGSATLSGEVCSFASVGCLALLVWRVLPFDPCLGAFSTLTSRGAAFFREFCTSLCLDGISLASFGCCCGCPLFLSLVSPLWPSLLCSSAEMLACFLGVEVLGVQPGMWRSCGVESRLALGPVNCVHTCVCTDMCERGICLLIFLYSCTCASSTGRL